jgi:hypothetical protein
MGEIRFISESVLNSRDKTNVWNLLKAVYIPVVCLCGLVLFTNPANAEVSRYAPGPNASGNGEAGATDTSGSDKLGGHDNPMPVLPGNHDNHGSRHDPPRRWPPRSSAPPDSGSTPPETGFTPPTFGGPPPSSGTVGGGTGSDPSGNAPAFGGDGGSGDPDGSNPEVPDGNHAFAPEPGLHVALGIGLLALGCIALRRRNACRRT